MEAEPERLFSSAKATMTDKRNQMKAETLEALESLKSWLRELHSERKEEYLQLLEKYSQLEEKYWQLDEQYLQLNEQYSQFDEQYSQLNEQDSQLKEQCSQLKDNTLYALWRIGGAKLGILDTAITKFIHLPEPLIERWHRDCQEALAQSLGVDATDKPSITRLDVVSAWFTQTSFSAYPADTGPVDIFYLFNYRPALPKPTPRTVYSGLGLRKEATTLPHMQ
ncbi:hypothetical protein VE00_02781 [Pseudogymnoascus sp. WSF 3629]|nr:hypothetical protein VE00_02781 [Pseudogymnoascus sp. WSF 3629]